MATQHQTCPKEIIGLVERFEQNVETYQSQAYNEAQVRQEFINPFFEALGWDVANKQGYAEAYKDVIHEDAIKVGGATKAPDYSFRVGGAKKFFLEAKKPAVNLKEDTSPAYQLRRYAWSAKLPLSVLTNFAEFAVYDCRLAPKESDKASVGRVLYLTYKDYAASWEKIASREKRGRKPFLLPSTSLFSGSAERAKGEFQPQLLRHPPMPGVGDDAGASRHEFGLHDAISLVKKKVCVPFCVPPPFVFLNNFSITSHLQHNPCGFESETQEWELASPMKNAVKG